MKYYIIICDNFSDMFVDLAQQLLYFLSVSGKIASIVDYSDHLVRNITDNDKCIFFGTHFKSKYVPNRSMLTVFDTLIHFHNIVPERLLHTNTILHYNMNEIHKLQEKYEGKLSVYYFKMGYNPYLDLQYKQCNTSHIYDAIFIGNVSPRRKHIIDSLINKGYNVFYGGYSPKYYTLNDIIPLYKRSKVILAIYTDDRTIDCTLGSRVYPAVSTNNFVITEESTNKLANSELSECSFVTSYDTMVNIAEYYIKHDIERENKKKEFYEYICKTPANVDLELFV